MEDRRTFDFKELVDMQKHRLPLVSRMLQEKLSKYKVVASAFYDARLQSKKGWIWIFAVLQDYQKLVRFFFEKENQFSISLVTVDRSLFEKDVQQAFLGELVAERLVLPYDSIEGHQYLEDQELRLKRRTILSSLGNLITEFSEISKGLRLRSEYFPLDYIQRRAKIYAPSKMLYQELSQPDAQESFLARVTDRFTRALNQLASEGVLTRKDDIWKIGENFVEKYLQKENPYPDFIEIFSKTARASLTNNLARIATPLQNLREAATKYEAAYQEETIHFPDSRKFLSSEIPLKINDATIEEAIHALLDNSNFYPKQSTPARVTKIGDILNTVFLIETESASGFKKIIVKSYDNWIGLKWFPLSLWTAGLRRFSRIGRKRLANEFFMNRDLRKYHFFVPEIFGLDWDRALLLEEFIDGTNVETLIRRIARAGQATAGEEDLLEKIGRLLGNIHQTGFMLGDCKPENFILSLNNDVYIVDLEQASKATDPAWDLAVFLYFAGRNAIRKSGIQTIVRDVIKGYVSVAPAQNIVKATRPPYPNFFTPITPLHIITEITKTCHKELLLASA